MAFRAEDLLERRPAPESLLPLKPVELLVLLMLSDGERHGYGIRQDIIAHTRGAISLEAGNLYRTIRRLDADGLLDESSRRPAENTDDERRRYYRLTPFGRRTLAAELERLRELVRLGVARRVIEPASA
jgi:DNA-binding PadR family transcriptional regulator